MRLGRDYPDRFGRDYLDRKLPRDVERIEERFGPRTLATSTRPQDHGARLPCKFGNISPRECVNIATRSGQYRHSRPPLVRRHLVKDRNHAESSLVWQIIAALKLWHRVCVSNQPSAVPNGRCTAESCAFV